MGRDGLQLFLGLSDHQHIHSADAYEHHQFDVRISADPSADGTPNLMPRVLAKTSHNVAKSIIGNIRARTLPGGYAFEGALPWDQPEAWHFTPAPGRVIEFNLQGRDNDQAVPATDTLMSLTGLLGAEQRPSSWTTAILLNAPPAMGDANGDGTVDMADVALTVQIAGGIVDAATGMPAFLGADYDRNGKVDMKDAAKINRSLRGL